MTESADCQFEIEVFPPGWVFPAGNSWVAGWLWLKQGRLVTDLRAWIDHRPCLALHGLPRPGLEEKLLGRAGPPYAGFVLQLAPHRDAALLRLEVRDTEGEWREFFRTTITSDPDAPARPAPGALAPRLTTLLPPLLRQHAARPGVPFATLADEVVSALLAEPLDSLPNPPFLGKLEEPGVTGRMRYGRLGVSGWLAHRTAKLARLTALADPVQESTLQHGLGRSDVVTVFADLRGCEAAQFVGQVDLPAGPPGPSLLKVFAELANGEKHLVFARRFTPVFVSGTDTPLPPLSRLVFARALWALRGAARRHGLPPGPGAELLAAARTAWSAYRAEAPVPVRTEPATHSASGSTRTASSRPLRLLVVTHNLNFEGAPRLIFELARYLASQPGNRVRVLSPQEGLLRRLYEDAGMPVTVVDLAATLAASSPAEFHTALGAAVQPDWSQVDLVVANSLVSFWAVHAAQRAGKPSLLYVHESSPVARFFGPLQLPPALFPVVEAALRDATRVAFTAAASRAVFAPLGGGNFRVCPSWLDIAAIDAFAAANPKASLRAKHGIDPAAVVLLNLGTVCERKGQHTFIRAATLLDPELRAAPPGRPVEFVMVGSRPDGFLNLLRLQVADAGLRNVRFVPETRENLDWLGLADLLVCTSFEESSPRVLLEAAAFKLPIVSTNVNGIPELVTEEEAWLVGPGDPHRLAAALRRALAALAAGDTARAARARRTVVARFDERVSLPQHLTLANETVAAYP